MRWLILFLCPIWPNFTYSQNTFFKTFHYTDNDQAYSLTECADGYIIMTIGMYSEGEPSPPVLIKLDKQGELLWTFNPDPLCYYSDFPITSHRCTLAPDSTILVCGRLSLSDTVGAVFVMKVTPSGDMIWQKIYKPYLRSKETNWTEQIVTWPNGDFLVTGVYYRLDNGSNIYPDSMFLFKCNTEGDLLHETKINYPPAYWAGYEGGDSGNPIILPNGDIFYCFFARWDTRYHPILVRMDADLNLQWRKEADGVMGRSYELKMASDGNILMFVEGGYNNYPWGVDPIIQKLTPDGDSLWTYSPPGINPQEGRDMAILRNGDIVYTSNPQGIEGVTCLSFDGAYKWKKQYNQPMSHPYDVQKFIRIIGTSDGGMLIAGLNQRNRPDPFPGIFDTDILVMKLDSMGCLYPGCEPLNYFVDAQDLIIAPKRYMQLRTNLPRPFSPLEVTIEDNVGSGQLRLMDAAGRVVWQQAVRKNNVVEIPTTDLRSGVYFLSLAGSEGILQTERVLIVY